MAHAKCTVEIAVRNTLLLPDTRWFFSSKTKYALLSKSTVGSLAHTDMNLYSKIILPHDITKTRIWNELLAYDPLSHNNFLLYRQAATNKTKKTKAALGLSVDNPRAKLLDLHNLGEEYFTGRIPMVSRFLRTWWQKNSRWCYPVHCILSWYGSRYGSAEFSQNPS